MIVLGTGRWTTLSRSPVSKWSNSIQIELNRKTSEFGSAISCITSYLKGRIAILRHHTLPQLREALIGHSITSIIYLNSKVILMRYMLQIWNNHCLDSPHPSKRWCIKTTLFKTQGCNPILIVNRPGIVFSLLICSYEVTAFLRGNA